MCMYLPVRKHVTFQSIQREGSQNMKERTKPKEKQLSVEEQRKLVKENLDATLKLGQKWSVSSKFSVLYSTGI